jgi:hypothetical protein
MEQLTVRQSIDNKTIQIEGTNHALDMVQALIRQLLADPEDREIRAKNPDSQVEIIIRLL